MKIDVLDKGYVRLVDYMGDDNRPLITARVSTDTDKITGESLEKDDNLLQYLLDERHTSPFESIVLTFEVKAPIFVFRQWHRHRTQSYNELSARYTPLPDECYIPKPENIGCQGVLQKQAREINPEDLTLADINQKDDEIHLYNGTNIVCSESYSKLLDYGWPRELARAILPVCWYSRMYTTVNLHNLFHFLSLRNHEHAQWEIRQYAIALEQIVAEKFPRIYYAWKKSTQSQYLKYVRKFHEKFGLKYEDGPRVLDDDLSSFRIKFLQEELDEYIEAAKENDLVKQFDALIDLIIVATGTAYLQGFPLDEGFMKVMNANMKKKRAQSSEESKRNSSFDIVKPSGWVSPEEDLRKLLNS